VNRNIEFPLNWPLSANIQKFENVNNDENDRDENSNDDTNEAEKTRVEQQECTLLIKYCSMFSFTSGFSTLHWWFWIMNMIKL